ncbi:F0F1 ATP synthase subunit B [[Mycobacterium] vasticus]|uniref:ATP synthase subunit b n=1 Tax=[Mycobacterium] vasticus TaxID=2875777 RepID=A0ABU5Z357_9MYCO|nr:F0F1 ATP synthase subunit B [Mycolicibacter sp. MYC017]MEB3071827.1 F0F1 ATP synthase subunit B [Mycolicibacter sp. MYC017]
MGDMSVVVLAVSQAAEEGEKKSFLIPDGTFFAVLAIFLIVLGVISTFVVPPIMKVLRERENMVTKTLADSRLAAEQAAAAEADYEQQMAAARVAASAVRDEARAQGRAVLEDMRGRADTEVAATLDSAGAQLKRDGDAMAADLSAKAEGLSVTLAGRILGVDASTVGR